MKELAIPRVLTNDVEEQLTLMSEEGIVKKYELTADTGFAVFAWGMTVPGQEDGGCEAAENENTEKIDERGKENEDNEAE